MVGVTQFMATTSWPRLVVATQTRVPHTPGILYEYQKKGLTEIAVRKLLILKDASCFAIRGTKNARKRKRGEATAALKNPQDYLKPILAKEPDRVKGIRAGERVRILEDIHRSRCEGHLACLCADFATLEWDRGDSNARAGSRRTRHGRDGQTSRGKQDADAARSEPYCLCAPVGIGFCVAACPGLAGLRGFVPHIL